MSSSSALCKPRVMVGVSLLAQPSLGCCTHPPACGSTWRGHSGNFPASPVPQPTPHHSCSETGSEPKADRGAGTCKLLGRSSCAGCPGTPTGHIPGVCGRAEPSSSSHLAAPYVLLLRGRLPLLQTVNQVRRSSSTTSAGSRRCFSGIPVSASAKSVPEQLVSLLSLPETRQVQLPPPAPGFGQDNPCSGSRGFRGVGVGALPPLPISLCPGQLAGQGHSSAAASPPPSTSGHRESSPSPSLQHKIQLDTHPGSWTDTDAGTAGEVGGHPLPTSAWTLLGSG